MAGCVEVRLASSILLVADGRWPYRPLHFRRVGLASRWRAAVIPEGGGHVNSFQHIGGVVAGLLRGYCPDESPTPVGLGAGDTHGCRYLLEGGVSWTSSPSLVKLCYSPGDDGGAACRVPRWRHPLWSFHSVLVGWRCWETSGYLAWLERGWSYLLPHVHFGASRMECSGRSILGQRFCDSRLSSFLWHSRDIS
jgi:hypothetical protein